MPVVPNGGREKSTHTIWPKKLAELTPEQERIRDDFFNCWLEELPKRYSYFDQFNQKYPLRTFRNGSEKDGRIRTLDIGAGRGEHMAYENLAQQTYVALELRPELAKWSHRVFPQASAVVGDCQENIAFPDGYFDRVLAIHVLEHLPNLPRALDEIYRVLKPSGKFSVVIPCEGGWAYTFARNISARPLFERRYKQSYDWFIACEHINMPDEVVSELQMRFQILDQTFFPLYVPSTKLNLVIGLTLRPLKDRGDNSQEGDNA